jgi:SAM-dependent methyltransferase
MHPEARAYVEGQRTDERLAVLEIGGRFINGGVRDLFPAADPYVSIDITEGPAVDIVANAATWTPDRLYDIVVCTEVFEHTPEWPGIVRTAAAACRPGGRLVLTMAGPGRSPHSAHGGPAEPDEFYCNVEPADLERELKESGWEDVVVDYLPNPGDTRATAVRGG